MPITDLWLPILIATIATFFLSFLTWAVLPHHKGDVKFTPEQDKIMDLVRASNLEPGVYMFPNCAERKDYQQPENIEKFNAGPWGTLSVWSGKPNMGRNMALTVLYFFLVSLLVAYLTSQARAPGSDFLAIFQIASTGAILAHVLGGAPNGIWFGKRLRFFLTDAIDGLIYALATGAIFALMWPAAETLVNTTP